MFSLLYEVDKAGVSAFFYDVWKMIVLFCLCLGKQRDSCDTNLSKLQNFDLYKWYLPSLIAMGLGFLLPYVYLANRFHSYLGKTFIQIQKLLDTQMHSGEVTCNPGLQAAEYVAKCMNVSYQQVRCRKYNKT